MLRNIHFFNIKPGVGKERILYLLDHKVAEHAQTFGCIERKTWKLLDAQAQGQPVGSAAYMNESLWPSQEAANAYSRAERPEEVRKWLDELLAGIEVVKTVRYVDDGG